MKNFYKWILTAIVFAVGYTGLFFWINRDVGLWLSFIGFIVGQALIVTPAIFSIKKYFDKVFDN